MQCPMESFDSFRVHLGQPYDSVITARYQVVMPNAVEFDRPHLVSSHQRRAQLIILPPRGAQTSMPPRLAEAVPFFDVRTPVK